VPERPLYEVIQLWSKDMTDDDPLWSSAVSLSKIAERATDEALSKTVEVLNVLLRQARNPRSARALTEAFPILQRCIPEERLSRDNLLMIQRGRLADQGAERSEDIGFYKGLSVAFRLVSDVSRELHEANHELHHEIMRLLEQQRQHFEQGDIRDQLLEQRIATTQREFGIRSAAQATVGGIFESIHKELKQVETKLKGETELAQ
jgi:hypothetical protein